MMTSGIFRAQRGDEHGGASGAEQRRANPPDVTEIVRPAETALGRGRRRQLTMLALLALLSLLGASGCSGRKAAELGDEGEAVSGPPARRAFYYWRTVLQLSEPERAALRELEIERLYLRMFDVAWQDERAQQVGKVTLADGAELPSGRAGPLEIVPVVFVREEVLRKLSREARAELTVELWKEVAARAAAMGFTPKELQLDCDWTDGTREAFFAMLAQLKALSGLPLSATIRLHQVKYRERTGVPPVERGMLMFYNMGKFSADPGSRMIFDEASAARYLARLGEYPLPLDVALPLWSWTVHVRDGGVLDVLQSTDPAELEGVDFLRRTEGRGGPRYVATRSTFFRGAFLREGDELVGEVTGPAEAAKAAAMLRAKLPRSGGAPRTLAFFDLSERNLARHDLRSLAALFLQLR